MYILYTDITHIYTYEYPPKYNLTSENPSKRGALATIPATTISKILSKCMTTRRLLQILGFKKNCISHKKCLFTFRQHVHGTNFLTLGDSKLCKV